MDQTIQTGFTDSVKSEMNLPRMRRFQPECRKRSRRYWIIQCGCRCRSRYSNQNQRLPQPQRDSPEKKNLSFRPVSSFLPPYKYLSLGDAEEDGEKKAPREGKGVGMSSVVDSWRRKMEEVDRRSQAAAGGLMKGESNLREGERKGDQEPPPAVSPQNKGLRRQSTLSEATISMLMDRFAPC